MSGALPISAEAINAYLQIKRIERDDDRDIFTRIVPQLDDVWLENHYAEAEKKKKTKKQ